MSSNFSKDFQIVILISKVDDETSSTIPNKDYFY